jgi:predicted nucleotidyltransferase
MSFSDSIPFTRKSFDMYLDPKSQITGIPAVQVRDFLKQNRDYEWTQNRLALSLNLSIENAGALVSELLQLGYIEATNVMSGQQYYQKTLAGTTFSLASASQPLTRRTAQKKLVEFIGRVQAVNVNEDFVYRVRRVLVFGSYLTERERINDIDVAIELVPRYNDPDKRMAAMQARIHQAYKAGRQFSSFVDELVWPEKEVLLFLKSRSRAISLHTTDDLILKQVPSEVVFQDETMDAETLHKDQI